MFHLVTLRPSKEADFERQTYAVIRTPFTFEFKVLPSNQDFYYPSRSYRGLLVLLNSAISRQNILLSTEGTESFKEKDYTHPSILFRKPFQFIHSFNLTNIDRAPHVLGSGYTIDYETQCLSWRNLHSTG